MNRSVPEVISVRGFCHVTVAQVYQEFMNISHRPAACESPWGLATMVTTQRHEILHLHPDLALMPLNPFLKL